MVNSEIVGGESVETLTNTQLLTLFPEASPDLHYEYTKLERMEK